jgi:pimeloyl-ACP methyl ester carboxylesterase
MDALGIPEAHILGISMGGMIAQELAINHREKVSKLVLCSTCSWWNPSKEGFRILSAMERGCSLEELAEVYLSFPFVHDYPIDYIRRDPTVVNVYTADLVKENPDLVNRYYHRFREHPPSKEGSRRQFCAVKEFNTEGRLHMISAPTLVLHGRKDFVCPPENGSILAGAIPKARFVLFEKSAHYLAEEMGAVTKVVTEFLL